MVQAAIAVDETRRTAGGKARPQRQCIVTRERGEPDALIRFVADPDGRIVPDLKGRLPGRGVWVGARRALVEQALKKKLFARALKMQVSADPGLPDLIDRLLAQACLGLLGLARKAGQVATGAEQVDRAIRSKAAGVVVQAADAAPDGCRKVRAALTASRQSGQVPRVAAFTSDELSLALGLPNVVHAAVLAGRHGEAFHRAALKVARYRGAASANAVEATQDGPIDTAAGYGIE